MYYEEKETPSREEKETVPLQPIIDMGSTVVRSRRGTIHCLTVIGQIEGHMNLPENTKTTKYEHILPLLAALEQSPEVDGLLLLLNTVGGDVEAGLGIAELAAGMKKPTASLVLGGGHSIAPGGVRQGHLHRPQRLHDHPPGAHGRHGHRRPGNLPLL